MFDLPWDVRTIAEIGIALLVLFLFYALYAVFYILFIEDEFKDERDEQRMLLSTGVTENQKRVDAGMNAILDNAAMANHKPYDPAQLHNRD